MVNSNTQQEALDYFRTHASEWSGKAEGRSASSVNIVKQRNDYVLQVISQRQTNRTALDVGCGTGDLVLELARRGIHGVGVDFAPEMIQIATENAGQENLSLSQFYCASIFEFDLDDGDYDCISANGFIEYISGEQLLQFLTAADQALNHGGSLVLGSRNRLFNLFSLNDFTGQEIEGGNASALLRESMAIVKAKSLNDLWPVDAAPLPDEELEQTKTGIDVSMRLQYTPVQLIKLLHGAGFEAVDLYPIHIHGVVPKFKDLYPKVHVDLSNQLQEHGFDHLELIPQASSFMVHARKVA